MVFFCVSEPVRLRYIGGVVEIMPGCFRSGVLSYLVLAL